MNGLKKILYRWLCGLKFIYLKVFNKNTFLMYINKWFFYDWDKNYLISHEIDNKSIVFEVWWYTWVFSDKIIEQYDPYMYIFEPVQKYYNILHKKYKKNSKIKVFHFWLSNKDEKININVEDDASSIFKNNSWKELIKLVDIAYFMKSEKIQAKDISLMSINIEWWEYDLLDRMLEKDYLPQRLQIQFHDFIKNADIKRKNILKTLDAKGYIKWYSFPFVWEYFIRKI